MTIPAGGGAFQKPGGRRIRILRFPMIIPEIPLWDQPPQVLSEYRCQFCGHVVEVKGCANCGAARGERT